MAIERSLILLKPDCLNGGHAGEVIGRFEKAGFEICAARLIALSDELLKEHYAHIADRPFFPEIVEFMSSRPVLALVLEENVSWGAHVGGIMAGAIMVIFMRRRGVPLFDRTIVPPRAAQFKNPSQTAGLSQIERGYDGSR